MVDAAVVALIKTLRALAAGGLGIGHQCLGAQVHASPAGAITNKRSRQVLPGVGRVILRWRCLIGGRERIGTPLTPSDRIWQRMVAGQVPVQNISPIKKQQPRQRQPITLTQGLLAITLAGPEVNRWDHPYKGSTISKHQQISGF